MKARRNLRGDGPGGESARPPVQSDGAEPVEVDVIRPDGRTVYPIDRRGSEALVIHCADPRFQTAFRRFVTEELGLATYTPIVFGGGIHALGAQAFLPKNFKVLWEQVKFFLKAGGLRQVIIINHEDCLWYRHMSGYHPTIELPTKQKLDLHHTAKMILEDFSGVQVRSYWAALEGDGVAFYAVEGR